MIRPQSCQPSQIFQDSPALLHHLPTPENYPSFPARS